MWPPVWMSDTFTAAEINNVKAQMSESVISFKQGGIGIGTVKLEREKKNKRTCSKFYQLSIQDFYKGHHYSFFRLTALPQEGSIKSAK